MKKCHFIGIGGIGMSGLARLMLQKNVAITGSDLALTPITEALKQEGVTVHLSHSAAHIDRETTVVYSTDIKKDNPEYQAALSLQCPLLHRSELLQLIMKEYRGLAVAGTHGKTTTSSLLTWVLEQGGYSPSYAIGGVVPQLSSNAGRGTGEYFVAEACESDGSVVCYHPYGAIITNIDNDHMDHYKSKEALVKAFYTFASQVQSEKHLFFCGDVMQLDRGLSYGFGEGCAVRASGFKQKGWSIALDISFQGKTYTQVEVSLTGRHNALNALAVFALALSLGMDEEKIRKGLKTFRGVGRRCEKKGEIQEILFLDDYAHHPTELKATLEAIRGAVGARRLIAVYQPHRYTRAQACMGLYGGVFDSADLVFINEIYAAREMPIPGVSHTTILEEIGSHAVHVPRDAIVERLCQVIKPHDVVVTLGAGDITKVSGEVLSRLNQGVLPKLKVVIISGGISGECEVSKISSANITQGIKKTLYDVDELVITKEGFWHLKGALPEKEKVPLQVMQKLIASDICFPVLHGPYGEDGRIQGFFDTLGKSYVGCDHRSAALAMDKDLSKRLALLAGIPTAPYVSFTRFEWKHEQRHLIDTIAQELTYPLFVKPVHLGSTIGVYKVTDKESLHACIEQAFTYDDKILVENGIEHPREIEFSVLGNEEPIVFPPGEIFLQGAVHDYDSKYGLNPSKPAASYVTKADLPVEKIEEGIALAKKIYQRLGCSGMARVDTFIDREGRYWFNEINPIPGFTKYSLYPLMCEANGLQLPELIDQLLIFGLARR